jgi:hypothetical protein
MPEIIRPNSEVNAAWFTPTVGNIDDAVLDPTAGDGITAVEGPGASGEQAYGFPAPSIQRVGSIVLKMYAMRDASGPTEFDVRLKVNGVFTASQSVSIGTSFGWVTATFSGQWTAITAIESWITINAMGPAQQGIVDVLYLELSRVAAKTFSGRSPTIKSPIV